MNAVHKTLRERILGMTRAEILAAAQATAAADVDRKLAGLLDFADDRISGGFPVYVNDPNSGEDRRFWPDQDDGTEPVPAEESLDVDVRLSETEIDGVSMLNLEVPVGDRASMIGEESISLVLVVTKNSQEMKGLLETEFIIPAAIALLNEGFKADFEDLLHIEQFPETMRLADIYATFRDSLNKPYIEAAALACLAFYGPGALRALMQ